MPQWPEAWSTTQRRTAEGAIESEQRAVSPRPVVELSEEGARLLGSRYWSEVGHASRGIVRPRVTPRGVELRFLGLGPALLTFGHAEVVIGDAEISCRYPIRGGVLARRAGGALTLAQRGGERTELYAAVHGFYPRLGPRPPLPAWSGALYEHIQRRAHVAISRRYFARLIGEGRR
jgi:hypothetical protein